MNKKERARIEVRNRQLLVIAFIRDNGKATPAQIASHFELEPASIAGIIGQLTKSGEITGESTGKHTHKGNTIMEYRLAGDIAEQPREIEFHDDFPLGKFFPLRIPDIGQMTGMTRTHVCKG